MSQLLLGFELLKILHIKACAFVAAIKCTETWHTFSFTPSCLSVLWPSYFSVSDSNSSSAVSIRKRHKGEAHEVKHSWVPRKTDPNLPEAAIGLGIIISYRFYCVRLWTFAICTSVCQCLMVYFAMWAAQLLEQTQHLSLTVFPCPDYKQRKWSDTLGFLRKQKEAKMCWIWSFTSYLASLPFLCSRRRWGKASLICRAGIWLQLGWICKEFLQGCCPHTTPSPGEGGTGNSRVKESHVPESQLHTEQWNPGQTMPRSPPPLALRSMGHLFRLPPMKTHLSLCHCLEGVLLSGLSISLQMSAHQLSCVRPPGS